MFLAMATLYKVLSGSHRATVKGVRTNVPRGKTFVDVDGLEIRFPNKLKALKVAPDKPAPVPTPTVKEEAPKTVSDPVAATESDATAAPTDNVTDTVVTPAPEAVEPVVAPTVEEELMESVDVVDDAPEVVDSAEELEAEVDEPTPPSDAEETAEEVDAETPEETAPSFDYKASQYYDELNRMTVAQLKDYAAESEINTTGASVKEDYIRLIATSLNQG